MIHRSIAVRTLATDSSDLGEGKVLRNYTNVELVQFEGVSVKAQNDFVIRLPSARLIHFERILASLLLCVQDLFLTRLDFKPFHELSGQALPRCLLDSQ